MDPISCASSGMFVNLSAVMLRLCEPFLDANLTKRDKIDPKYVFNGNRLDLRCILFPWLSVLSKISAANYTCELSLGH